jgi:hypothetical protein
MLQILTKCVPSLKPLDVKFRIGVENIVDLPNCTEKEKAEFESEYLHYADYPDFIESCYVSFILKCSGAS